MMGTVVGVARMILDFAYEEPRCGEPDNRPLIIVKMHYMYFAMLLFWLSGITMIVLSLLTKAPDKEKVMFLFLK